VKKQILRIRFCKSGANFVFWARKKAPSYQAPFAFD